MVGPGGHSGAQTRMASMLPEKDLQPRTIHVRLATYESTMLVCSLQQTHANHASQQAFALKLA
jgi:hypothetical protein